MLSGGDPSSNKLSRSLSAAQSRGLRLGAAKSVHAKASSGSQRYSSTFKLIQQTRRGLRNLSQEHLPADRLAPGGGATASTMSQYLEGQAFSLSETQAGTRSASFFDLHKRPSQHSQKTVLAGSVPAQVSTATTTVPDPIDRKIGSLLSKAPKVQQLLQKIEEQKQRESCVREAFQQERGINKFIGSTYQEIRRAQAPNLAHVGRGNLKERRLNYFLEKVQKESAQSWVEERAREAEEQQRLREAQIDERITQIFGLSGAIQKLQEVQLLQTRGEEERLSVQ